MLRSGVVKARARAFGDQLCAWIKEHGFSNVVALTGVINPIRGVRESNRQ